MNRSKKLERCARIRTHAYLGLRDLKTLSTLERHRHQHFGFLVNQSKMLLQWVYLCLIVNVLPIGIFCQG